MASKEINAYTAATTIDGAADYLLIDPGSTGNYNKINRNTLLGVTGTPADLSTLQTFTNKTIGNTNNATLKDGSFTLQNSSSTTKQAQFSLASITAGNTRTYTLPDITDTLVTLTATQTLTNKTLTSPTINSPTITNASVTADSISGYTVSNTGTIYGVAVTTGQITGANTVSNSALASGVSFAKFFEPYKFQYYLAGTVTNPGNVWAQMKFDTKVFDTGSNYSTSTNLFTAPVNGFYQFNAAYGCSSTTDGQLVSIGINKNTFSTSPTYQGITFDNGGTSLVALTMSKLIQLTAGDTIGVYFYNNSGTQIAFTGTNPMYTYFEGFLVSAT